MTKAVAGLCLVASMVVMSLCTRRKSAASLALRLSQSSNPMQAQQPTSGLAWMCPQCISLTALGHAGQGALPACPADKLPCDRQVWHHAGCVD